MPQAGPGDTPEEINEQLGEASAQYLRPGATIDIGWGDTLPRALFAPSRDSRSLMGVTIAIIAGGIDAYTRRVPGSSTNDLGTHIRFVPPPPSCVFTQDRRGTARRASSTAS